jgi:cyclophilin family peptidyl-prolyl cis-trans isomerase
MKGLRWVILTSLLAAVAAAGVSCSSKKDSSREESGGAGRGAEGKSQRWTGWWARSEPSSATMPATVESIAATKPSRMRPVVLVDTSEGKFKLELWPDRAPITAANFLRYADDGFYDGTVFHRVIDGFIIQGGGFTARMEQKKAHEPIKNEAKANLRNLRGTVAMARMDAPDSATCEFFVNLVDNSSLNHTDQTPRGFGYAVFGRVVEGIEVVDKIGKVPTTVSGLLKDVPIQPVVINRVSRIVP